MNIYRDATWSPDDEKIVFTRQTIDAGPPDIWLINADGSGGINLMSLENNFYDELPDWAPME